MAGDCVWTIPSLNAPTPLPLGCTWGDPPGPHQMTGTGIGTVMTVVMTGTETETATMGEVEVTMAGDIVVRLEKPCPYLFYLMPPTRSLLLIGLWCLLCYPTCCCSMLTGFFLTILQTCINVTKAIPARTCTCTHMHAHT